MLLACHDAAKGEGRDRGAGVRVTPLGRAIQCFELRFGVDHPGTFALTGLLPPKFAETLDSHPVVAASLAHNGDTPDWTIPARRAAPAIASRACVLWRRGG